METFLLMILASLVRVSFFLYLSSFLRSHRNHSHQLLVPECRRLERPKETSDTVDSLSHVDNEFIAQGESVNCDAQCMRVAGKLIDWSNEITHFPVHESIIHRQFNV